MNRTCQNLLVLLPAIFVTGCHEQSDAVSLDEIIERNTGAMGGRGAIEATRSVQIELHIKDPSFEVDGNYYATRPGKMRIDVSAQGKRVFTEAFDGRNGWQWEGKGEQMPATGKATAALNDGAAISLYVDPNSWLVTRRRDVRALHVDVDPRPTTIEQVSSDFHDVDGVKFPFATAETDLNTGKLLESTHHEKREDKSNAAANVVRQALTSSRSERTSRRKFALMRSSNRARLNRRFYDDLANYSAYRRLWSNGRGC